MKHLAKLILLLLLLPTVVVAQDFVGAPDEEVNSVPKVMIIPFNPDLYFSDADHELAEYNRVNIKKVKHHFQYGLDMDLNVRVLSGYESKQILRDTAMDAKEDLQAIYKGISYKYEKPFSGEHEKEDNLPWHKKMGKKVVKPRNDSESALNASSYKDVKEEDKKYMNVVPHDKEMFSYLSDKYGTDLYVFINQFELKTNYEECLDRARKIFQREVSVHFSIYNNLGEQIYGNVVTITFPSNSNDIDQIIRNNFPMITEFIMKRMPK